MMIRDKVKKIAAGMVVSLVLGTGVLMACATETPPVTPSEAVQASASARQNDGLPIRYIYGDQVMGAVSPDGKQMIGLSRKTGAVSRVDGNFDMNQIIVGGSAMVYSSGGDYYAFGATTAVWSKLSIPNENAPAPAVGSDLATIQTKDHLYVFTDASGKWTTVY